MAMTKASTSRKSFWAFELELRPGRWDIAALGSSQGNHAAGLPRAVRGTAAREVSVAVSQLLKVADF
jgi:hypothetical protein